MRLVPIESDIFIVMLSPFTNIIMVPTNNMKIVFETARMYTGDPPNLPLDRIFGVTTFELG